MTNDVERINAIKEAIQLSSDRWRQRFPLLANKDLIGLSVFSASITGILISAAAYLNGALSAIVCILIVAFLTSLLHELEHDLIHRQYFKKNKFMHNLMMLGVWLFRPGTINPWIRRHLHFLHHKTSGTERDIEEIGIGNGQRYSALRWLIMSDPFAGNIAKVISGNESKKIIHVIRIIAAYFPFGVASAIIFYAFMGFHGTNAISQFAGLSIEWSATTLAYMEFINPLFVILIAPHYLRSFCIIFISSNMHYYGNVDSVLKQTQVLNAWYFLPFQLFCFNFGSTHGIHHFVVGEPFYIRQLTAKDAHKAMRENGVPFNDIGTFKRKNRYPVNN